MSDDYGKIVDSAIQVVRQLHSDSSRLLQDCDGTIGHGKTSVHGSTATKSLTYHIKSGCWMASGVFRYYADPKDLSGLVDGVQSGLVEGLTICFFDHKSRFKEPVLIVGRIKYSGRPVKDLMCRDWDLWYGAFDKSPRIKFGIIIEPGWDEPERIEWMRLISVPLYTINGMDDVVSLMDRLRTA